MVYHPAHRRLGAAVSLDVGAVGRDRQMLAKSGIARIFAHPDFRSWLKADIQSLEIEVCFTPNNGHSLGRQIQAPACRGRDGFADAVQIAGIRLI